MSAVSTQIYALPSSCTVKWTATQEKSISKDYPFIDIARETPEDCVSRTYLQFLWLPESVAPLAYLVPALLRIVPHPGSPQNPEPSSSLHPLHNHLKPLLLTPRACSDKYQSHILQVLADDGGAGDAEETMMWYALRYEKTEGDGESNAKPELDEEKWSHAWLARMEHREVQIQILLHLLLLSLSPPSQPGAVGPVHTELPPELLPSPRQRKRKPCDPSPHPFPLEEGLEFLMDKLSMWQLTASLEEEEAKRGVYGKGKQKSSDDRDWMQIFCEDVVEPIFKANLPELCAMLRSKVFQTSVFSDEDDPFMSPPPSPRLNGKQAVSTSKTQARDVSAQANANDRLRSRSLSVSLEQERSRSRSVSIDAETLKRRMLSREVSMSTVFKGKTKASNAKAFGTKPEASHLSRKKPAPAAKDTNKKRDASLGVTLVAATPTKPRVKTQPQHGSTFPQPSFLEPQRSRMTPSRLEQPVEELVEGDGDDDEWTLTSSPGILLLGSAPDDEDGAERPERMVSSRRRSNVLAASTPTKKRRIDG